MYASIRTTILSKSDLISSSEILKMSKFYGINDWLKKYLIFPLNDCYCVQKVLNVMKTEANLQAKMNFREIKCTYYKISVRMNRIIIVRDTDVTLLYNMYTYIIHVPVYTFLSVNNSRCTRTLSNTI